MNKPEEEEREGAGAVVTISLHSFNNPDHPVNYERDWRNGRPASVAETFRDCRLALQLGKGYFPFTESH